MSLISLRVTLANVCRGDFRGAILAMFDSGLPALDDARAKLGLPPLGHLLDRFRAAETELLATARAFDYPAECLPEGVRYVGPLVGDPHWARPWSSPWPPSDERPLVVVGFSTTFQDHARVLQDVIDALAPLPIRVQVTLIYDEPRPDVPSPTMGGEP